MSRQRLDVTSQAALSLAEQLTERYGTLQVAVQNTVAQLRDEHERLEEALAVNRDTMLKIGDTASQELRVLDSHLRRATDRLGTTLEELEDRTRAAASVFNEEINTAREAAEEASKGWIRAAETAQAFAEDTAKAIAERTRRGRSLAHRTAHAHRRDDGRADPQSNATFLEAESARVAETVNKLIEQYRRGAGDPARSSARPAAIGRPGLGQSARPAPAAA